MSKLNRKKELQQARDTIINNGLYLAKRKDINMLSEIAVDAYENYPLHNWFTKGKYNKTASRLIMKISLKTMLKKAVIYADNEDAKGFAIWLPRGFKGSKTLPFLFNGGLKLVLCSGLGLIARLLKYETHAMKLKKKYTNHNDWYLYNLSIKTKSQGSGIASKLLKPMLEFCSANNHICYLETNKESNVSLYNHFAFELVEENYIPKTNVKHYAMLKK